MAKPHRLNAIDRTAPMRDIKPMNATTIKSELIDIAKHIPDSASYGDAMYELYVRMKVARGRKAADEGRVVPHAEVKRRFAK